MVRYQLRHGPLLSSRSPGHWETIHTAAGVVISRGPRLADPQAGRAERDGRLS
ncbi:hypothetical protein AB0C04_06145 [Micromonospora sp. NPDC048909]|uniref:hypothetical protein n=1 Tax=Micromonospora sp. NPDC048909 TaxID=3155643 RepID=UPI0034047E58